MVRPQARNQMCNAGRQSSERGSVIAFVLALVAILGVAAVAFRTGVTLNGVENLRAETRAQATRNAMSGLAFCQSLLAEEPTMFLDEAHPLLKGNPSEVTFPDITFRIARPAALGPGPSVESVNAKLNLNQATGEMLARMMDVNSTLAANLRRWQLRGPFRSWSDLSGIPGWPKDSAEPGPVSHRFLTVFDHNGVDINRAPAEVLAAVTGLTSSELGPALTYRAGADGDPGTPDDRSFQSVDSFFSFVAPEVQAKAGRNGLITESTVFEVWVTGYAPLPGPPPAMRKTGRNPSPRLDEVSIYAVLVRKPDGVRVPVVVNMSPRPL